MVCAACWHIPLYGTGICHAAFIWFLFIVSVQHKKKCLWCLCIYFCFIFVFGLVSQVSQNRTAPEKYIHLYDDTEINFFILFLYVSSYRWVHFSAAALFCQPHQKVFTHSFTGLNSVRVYIEEGFWNVGLLVGEFDSRGLALSGGQEVKRKLKSSYQLTSLLGWWRCPACCLPACLPACTTCLKVNCVRTLNNTCIKFVIFLVDWASNIKLLVNLLFYGGLSLWLPNVGSCSCLPLHVCLSACLHIYACFPVYPSS